MAATDSLRMETRDFAGEFGEFMVSVTEDIKNTPFETVTPEKPCLSGVNIQEEVL
jgi:hypothetical protein